MHAHDNKIFYLNSNIFRNLYMNFSTYIFGVFSSGYSQYPDDSCSELFQRMGKECEAVSQIIIHRDAGLMYYFYIRKLDKKRYLGFSVVINGYFLSEIKLLFSVFEKGIEELVEKGVIINFTNEGRLTSSLSSLLEEEGETWSFIAWLKNRIESVGLREKPLPPLDYGISIDSRKIMSHADDNSAIVKASYRFGFTFVLKKEDFNTIRLTSFKNTLRNLNHDIGRLKKENAELRNMNSNRINISLNRDFSWGWKTWTLFGFLMAIILITACLIFSNPKLRTQFLYSLEIFIP